MNPTSPPTAQTSHGTVAGEHTRHGAVFRGIPYAAAPVGPRRFRPPAPPAPWSGTRDCRSFAPDCPQARLGRAGGVLSAFNSTQRRDEDCLAVNVWTPAVDDGHRPTMVWIHGGAYISGSGATPIYDGTAFARDGVVLVTLNYRLHALGFLYLDDLFDDAEGTGNLAILDQIAALEWVRDNIAAFGGDPDNVSIFGESAGAGCIGTLLGTPAADGLYHRAILQSGAASHELPPATATTVARQVLDLLDVRPGDWSRLQAVPSRQIVLAAGRVWLRSPRLLGDQRHLKLPFLPVTDGVLRHCTGIERVAAGERAEVKLLVGTNADEYRAFVWGVPLVVRRSLPRPSINSFFDGGSRTAAEVRATYARARPGASEQDVVAAIEGDQMFTIPAIRLAEAQTAKGGLAWIYRFTWPSPANRGTLGACHGLDVAFVFDTLAHAGRLWGRTAPQSLADTMHAAWIRFAATGDPNSDGAPTWPPYDQTDRPVMTLGATCGVQHDPRRDERLEWGGVW